jgi:TamB, inner membrane protein subunit of TAM complex
LRIRRLLKFLFLGSLSALATLLLALTCVLKWPTLVVNEKTLGWIAQLAQKRGIELTWANSHLSIESLTFFEKRLTLRASDLCLRFTDNTFATCFNEVSLTAALSFRGFPKLKEAGPIRLLGGTLSVRPSPGPSEGSPGIAIPDWLKAGKLAPIAIEVQRLDLDLGETRIFGKTTLLGTPTVRKGRDGMTWSLSTDARVHSGDKKYQGEGSLVVNSLNSQWEGPWDGRIRVNGKLGKREVLNISGTATQREKSAVFNLAAHSKIQGMEFSANLNGEGQKNRVAGKLQGSAKGLIKEISQIRLEGCEFTLAQDGNSARGNLHLRCPIAVLPSLPTVPHGGPPLDFIKLAKVEIQADLNTPFPPSAAEAWRGTVRANLTDVKNAMFQGTGGAEVTMAGDLSHLPESLHLHSKINLSVHLGKFESVVALCARYPAWSVPEPLNSLKGTIELAVNGEGEIPWELRVFPLTVTTRLKSATQKLDLDAKAELKLEERKNGWTAHLGSKIVLSDVRLVLPYLNLEAPPRFFPDSRLALAKPPQLKTESNFIFRYDILVETPNGHPARLVSNLAKRPVPIAVRVAVKSDTPSEIMLRVDSFPVEVFRRQAQVQFFQATTTSNRKDLNLKGSIQVNYTDYTIHIVLGGTAATPDIQLTSSPPLNKNEIISVLLFGKRLEELESTQTESVGSAKAAVTDGAVSLASMYILASTPVESVGYNPDTQMFSAKVRLADGTSLNVGSDFGNESRVGIRQRLGPNWSINTYLLNPFDSLHRSLNAFLEWNRRY